MTWALRARQRLVSRRRRAHEIILAPDGQRAQVSARSGSSRGANVGSMATLQSEPTVAVVVNGTPTEHAVEARTLLVQYLRDVVGLTGTNIGCDTSSCGSCTVLLDGESVKSCTLLAAQADGRAVTTIEGLASNGEMHPLQEAFHRNHGLQCGYCTPGMILAAASYLKENPTPSEEDVRESLEGNLCRCTGYQNIVKSILDAAGSMSGAKA